MDSDAPTRVSPRGPPLMASSRASAFFKQSKSYPCLGHRICWLRDGELCRATGLGPEPGGALREEEEEGEEGDEGEGAVCEGRRPPVGEEEAHQRHQHPAPAPVEEPFKGAVAEEEGGQGRERPRRKRRWLGGMVSMT